MAKNKLADIESMILTALLSAEKELRYSEIRQICKLTDPTLAKYLKILCQKKYILKRKSRDKREYPHPVFYKVNNDINIFKKLVAEFSEYTVFHSSTYCQNMITRALLREIEKIQDTEPFTSKALIDNPDVFTEEDVLEILRLSPTALKKSLQDSLEDSSSERFTEMLLAAFILDVNTRFYRSCTFKVEMSLEFPRPGKEPFFKRSKSSVFSIMPDEY